MSSRGQVKAYPPSHFQFQVICKWFLSQRMFLQNSCWSDTCPSFIDCNFFKPNGLHEDGFLVGVEGMTHKTNKTYNSMEYTLANFSISLKVPRNMLITKSSKFWLYNEGTSSLQPISIEPSPNSEW